MEGGKTGNSFAITRHHNKFASLQILSVFNNFLYFLVLMKLMVLYEVGRYVYLKK